MKLRNKKTGEIRTAYVQVILENNHPAKPLEFNTQLSIAELNAEWEDYEEPKKYWYISRFGYVVEDIDEDFDADKTRKEIGNYFETKEDAEKAVEKLKAWKRLKDARVSFDLATLSDETTITIFARKKNHIHDYDEEIFTIFGGEK